MTDVAQEDSSGFVKFQRIKGIIEALTQHTKASAWDNGLITAEEVWYFGASDARGAQIKSYAPNGGGGDSPIIKAAVQMAGSDEQSRHRVAQYLAVDTIVHNALDYFYRALITDAPLKQCEDFLRRGIQAGGDDFIKAVEECYQEDGGKALFEITTTMHPTIYHTEFAREIEAKLTGILEKISDHLQSGEDTEGLMQQAQTCIDDLVRSTASGKKEITPSKKVTVVEENTLDRKNHNAMKDNFKAAREAFNEAAQNIAMEIEASDASLAGRLRQIKIAPEQFDPQAWTQAADADGRYASSIELYMGIQRRASVGAGRYISRKRSMRENASEHMKAVSCLLQAASSSFYDQEGQLHDRISAELGPGQEILQDMAKEKQAELLKALIAEDSYLPPNFQEDLATIKTGTIVFNEMFIEVYNQFLLDHQELPDTTDLQSLMQEYSRNPDDPREPRKLLLELADRVAAVDVTDKLRARGVAVPAEEGPVHFELDLKNLTYERRPYRRHAKILDGTQLRSIVPRAMTEAETRGIIDKALAGEPIDELIADVRKMQTRTPLMELGRDEERKLLDVVKRLQVLDYEIGEEFDNSVADRYQIANFSSSADFYAAMLLFKETGIIKVDQGKVQRVRETLPDERTRIQSPKLSIQPLLETIEDQGNAKDIFTELLNDDLVCGYYEALGNEANIMVGYSDGAKSAGNFASEWSIYKTARDLHELFHSHGITLHVFHGRGRGDSRGGQFDPGQDLRMMDPVLGKQKILDETQQADLPMAEDISRKFGTDQWIRRIIGMATATREANAATVTPDVIAEFRRYDSVLDTIAEASAKEYQRLVRDPEATRTFLKTIHDNPFKSSRPSSRGGDPEFDDIRAITVEYGFNMADAPLHYVGLKHALGKQDMTTLRELYASNEFFRGEMDKTAQGLIDYDPEVFRCYAVVAGVRPWAEGCIAELDGLRDLVQEVRGQEAEHATPQTGDAGRIEQILSARGANAPVAVRRAELLELTPLRESELLLDKNAHALALAGTVSDDALQPVTETRNPLKPGDGSSLDASIMRLLTFVNQAALPRKMLRPPKETRLAVEGIDARAR